MTDFKFLKDKQNEYKKDSVQGNMEIFNGCEFKFQYNTGPQVVMFRLRRISADFYVSTNKWKDNTNGQEMHHGDARAFLRWLRKTEPTVQDRVLGLLNTIMNSPIVESKYEPRLSRKHIDQLYKDINKA